jgi:RHS repeat-associated protein
MLLKWLTAICVWKNTALRQFTGRENDGTGLYYLRARYYNPLFGRFLSEDPAGLSEGRPRTGSRLRQ